MKGRFWRKALAAALALLVVSGNVPIRSVADLFGGAAITASALESEVSGPCGDNATWVYGRDSGTLTISGTGEMDSVGWEDYKDEISSVIIGDGITSICDDAFAFCNNLASVAIPYSVESIGESAFAWCGSLTSVEIPDSVTSIGDHAFEGCEALNSVTIPNGVESIGDAAFAFCSYLTFVEIPDSVTSIGNSAFERCWNLNSVTIPNSVESIGNSAFASCGGLTSVRIPDSVTSIGNSAFRSCESLEAVYISDSVTYIGRDAFLECTRISEFDCDADPANLTWDDGDCNDFKPDKETVCCVPSEYYLEYVKKFGNGSENPANVTFDTDAPHGQCGENAYWLLDSGKLTISGTGDMDYVGWDKDEIAFVEIENGITSILVPAFKDCAGLTSVIIPDSVTYIGADAFKGCTNITDVYCYADPDKLTWYELGCDDFIKTPKHTTVCHVPKKYLEDYEAKFGAGSDYPVNVKFVGDLVDMGLGEHLYGHSITLDGSIGVNFYVELTGELLASETAAMVFTVPNGSKTDTQTLLVKDVIAVDRNKVSIGGKTYYKFKCSVSAKDMASEITAQMFDGYKAGTEYRYSVKEYADYLLAHPEIEEYANAAPLVKAMLNYGAASQSYFKEGAVIGEVPDMTDVAVPNTFKFDEDNVDLPEGVTFEGVTLSLKSETTLSLYFKSSTDLSFMCVSYEVEKDTTAGGYQIARIRGIKADDLDKTFKLNIVDASESGSIRSFGGNIAYCPLTYCYNVLNGGSEDENLQNVCKALYKYAQAAKTYSE